MTLEMGDTTMINTTPGNTDKVDTGYRVALPDSDTEDMEESLSFQSSQPVNDPILTSLCTSRKHFLSPNSAAVSGPNQPPPHNLLSFQWAS